MGRWSTVVESLCSRHFVLGAGLQDATQEVWSAVLRKLAQHQYYDSGRGEYFIRLSSGDQEALIRRTARDRISGLVRSRRRYRARHVLTSDHSNLDEMYDSGAIDPLTRLESAELRGRIKRAIASLGSDLAALVLARYVNEEKSRDLARRYGVSESAISRRLQAARQMLKDLLFDVKE